MLTAIVGDLTDLRAENKSTQKSIFHLKQDVLRLESLIRKSGDYF
jgi:hypothetical protein